MVSAACRARGRLENWDRNCISARVATFCSVNAKWKCRLTAMPDSDVIVGASTFAMVCCNYGFVITIMLLLRECRLC